MRYTHETFYFHIYISVCSFFVWQKSTKEWITNLSRTREAKPLKRELRCSICSIYSMEHNHCVITNYKYGANLHWKKKEDFASFVSILWQFARLDNFHNRFMSFRRNHVQRCMKCLHSRKKVRVCLPHRFLRLK